MLEYDIYTSTNIFQFVILGNLFDALFWDGKYKSIDL